MSLKKLKKFKSYTYQRKKYFKLEQIGKRIDWLDDIQKRDPNEAINQLIVKVKNCVEKAKTKTNNKQRKTTPRKNWITTEIINSSLTKEKLYEKWK